MYKVFISHEIINWKVLIETNCERMNSMLFNCFNAFTCTTNNNQNKIENKLKIEKIKDYYFIHNTDFNKVDINTAVGILLEIICSQFFLRSEKYVFIHGASMVKDNKATLIIAPTMSGKTTLASLMVMKGYKYLSDDVVPLSIDNLTITTFPKIMTIRDTEILHKYKQNWLSYFSDFSYKIKNFNNINKNIESRSALLPKNTCITSEMKQYEVENILILNRIKEIRSAYVQKVERGKAILYLSQNLRSPYDLIKFRKIVINLVKKNRCI